MLSLRGASDDAATMPCNACAADLAYLCPDELDMQGTALETSYAQQMCLMRRQEELSCGCLDSLLAQESNLVTMCFDDIETFCHCVTPGDSRVHKCLEESIEFLAPNCQRQLGYAPEPPQSELGSLFRIFDLLMGPRNSAPVALLDNYYADDIDDDDDDDDDDYDDDDLYSYYYYDNYDDDTYGFSSYYYDDYMLPPAATPGMAVPSLYEAAAVAAGWGVRVTDDSELHAPAVAVGGLSATTPLAERVVESAASPAAPIGRAVADSPYATWAAPAAPTAAAYPATPSAAAPGAPLSALMAVGGALLGVAGLIVVVSVAARSSQRARRLRNQEEWNRTVAPTLIA
jgi:hypothetical protein